MKNQHPRLAELADAKKQVDDDIQKHREERAILSTQFAALENNQAAIHEKLTAKRRSLDLNRKRGRALGDKLDAIRDERKSIQVQIDAALGNVEVKVMADQLAPGKISDASTAEPIAGKAGVLAKRFDMTVQEIIEHAGGTISWPDLKVSFPESAS